MHSVYGMVCGMIYVNSAKRMTIVNERKVFFTCKTKPEKENRTKLKRNCKHLKKGNEILSMLLVLAERNQLFGVTMSSKAHAIANRATAESLKII